MDVLKQTKVYGMSQEEQPNQPQGLVIYTGKSVNEDKNRRKILQTDMHYYMRLHIPHESTVMDVPLFQKTDSIIIGRGAKQDTGVENYIDLTPFHAYQYGISRHHVAIDRVGSRIMVKDLGSTNGTHLNEEKLTPYNVYEINHGDTIVLGDMKMEVYFADA